MYMFVLVCVHLYVSVYHYFFWESYEIVYANKVKIMNKLRYNLMDLLQITAKLDDKKEAVC